jgi:hypothetical protein
MPMDESSTDFAFIVHLVDQVGSSVDSPLDEFLERLSPEDRDIVMELMDAGNVDAHATVLDLLAAIKPSLEDHIFEEDAEETE